PPSCLLPASRRQHVLDRRRGRHEPAFEALLEPRPRLFADRRGADRVAGAGLEPGRSTGDGMARGSDSEEIRDAADLSARRVRDRGPDRLCARWRAGDFVPAADLACCAHVRRGAACCAPTGGLMAPQRVGVIMNGVTGRMGLNQHLVRSILAIREQGGVALPSGDRLVPDPILVGRNEAKLRDIAATHGRTRVSTDLDACLANPADTIYFDATVTSLR